MNNITVGMLLAIGSITAATTDLPQELLKIFDESVVASQQVCTAGDMHSMSVMLDAKYVMDRRLPTEEQFEPWLNVTFKENNVKDLAEDHWGTKYIYKVLVKNKRYQLRSAGPDGIAGTNDDMIKTGP